MSDPDQYLKRPVSCACGWVGLNGELIASGRPGGLRCPKCDDDKGISYFIAEGTATKQ